LKILVTGGAGFTPPLLAENITTQRFHYKPGLKQENDK